MPEDPANNLTVEGNVAILMYKNITRINNFLYSRLGIGISANDAPSSHHSFKPLVAIIL